MASSPYGKKIKAARIARGLSVAELAKMARINRASLYRIEAGAVPHAATVRRLAQALAKAKKLPDF